MSTGAGGPAFPIHPASAMDGQLVRDTQGMTLRDYFAAKAMQAIMSGPEWQLLQMKDIAANNDGDVEGVIAHFSYKMAGAMLAARESAAKQADHICPGCGVKGWTGNCDKCIPY